jgi:hypothetical protein
MLVRCDHASLSRLCFRAACRVRHPSGVLSQVGTPKIVLALEGKPTAATMPETIWKIAKKQNSKKYYKKSKN